MTQTLRQMGRLMIEAGMSQRACRFIATRCGKRVRSAGHRGPVAVVRRGMR